jgi:hypothetical protein
MGIWGVFLGRRRGRTLYGHLEEQTLEQIPARVAQAFQQSY